MFQMLFQLLLLLLGFQMPLAIAQKIKYACSEIHEKYKMYLRFFFNLHGNIWHENLMITKKITNRIFGGEYLFSHRYSIKN